MSVLLDRQVQVYSLMSKVLLYEKTLLPRGLKPIDKGCYAVAVKPTTFHWHETRTSVPKKASSLKYDDNGVPLDNISSRLWFEYSLCS